MHYDEEPRVQVRETRTYNTTTDSTGTAIGAIVIVALLAIIAFFAWIRPPVGETPAAPPIIVSIPEPQPKVVIPPITVPTPDYSGVEDAKQAAQAARDANAAKPVSPPASVSN